MVDSCILICVIITRSFNVGQLRLQCTELIFDHHWVSVRCLSCHHNHVLQKLAQIINRFEMFHKICVSVTSLFINFAVTSFSTNLTPRENGFLPPYVNRYCTSYFSSDFVHYGCCDKKFPESHCFLNDWGTRDAVCETQNLQANRFNFTCSNSILDHNCTVPKGTFFCCSK